MRVIRDIESDLRRFRSRMVVVTGAILILFGFLSIRLFYLQVVRYDELNAQAENNRTAIVPIVPNRGVIMDRNGIVLATNYSAYTLEITASKVIAPLEEVIEQLSSVIDIQARDKRRFKKQLGESKSFESVPIRNRLTDEEVARFAAQRYRFPGVEIRARLFRNYPYNQLASHVIGYIGRINPAEKGKIEESDDAGNYRGTDYIGKLGVEQSYETQLHGTTGVQEMETSAGGRAVRRLNSSQAVPGNSVVLSIDIKLQKLVEDLYGKRRGALVALDPKTGEVLAFVSKPTFDPNLFVDGIDSENWAALNESIDKPLLNRALRGTYPPGSTYKPFMALAALQTGKRSEKFLVSDPGYFMFGNHRFRDDKEGGHGSVDMYKSIVESCDTYYYTLARDMGVDLMHDQMKPLGFGQITGIDILGESRGVLPSTEWKRNTYKKPEQQRWYSGETISLGIGQGYNNFTMLQIAHAMGTVANNGLKMKPHLVREVVDVETKSSTLVAKEPVGQLALLPENLEVIKKGMIGVNVEGTSATSFVGAQYVSAGKTGTAQVFTVKQNEKYNAATIDERMRDHALFVAFAPADDPKVALAMVVENAGFGAQNAAPIARRVFDFVIMGQYPSQEDIEAVQKGQATRLIGKSRPVASVPWPPKAAELAVEEPVMAASAAAKAASAAAKAASAAGKPASAAAPAVAQKPVASGAR
ncbi:penicillin-binding protein 2 [Limnohabitans sp. TS-CS-82]|uniref:penicillin-binding protein 2 n=1 Tax=Limnohabitans sp. TS-CS-82 TaxID=2094193 RepID=UPI000CF2BEFF|nr:penicillin-binding protein 2 [Limnohabitans sp. TS-CS-82]PQA84974.1 penicillin-binding protein 2 [Limnohabitans sp. TS-CS-82]